KDSLLMAMLCATPNVDVGLERLLTMARRALLEAALAGGGRGTGFSAALAQQCFINEYVFFQDADETAKAGRLREEVAQALENGEAVTAAKLLALASYCPL